MDFLTCPFLNADCINVACQIWDTKYLKCGMLGTNGTEVFSDSTATIGVQVFSEEYKTGVEVWSDPNKTPGVQIYTDVDSTELSVKPPEGIPAAAVLVSEYYGDEDLDDNGLIYGVDFYITDDIPMLEGIPPAGIAMTRDEYNTTLTLPYTAKSIIFDIANNHGNLGQMGIRSIEFFLNNVLINVASNEITCYGNKISDDYKVDYAFTTGLSKTGTSTNTSWENNSTTNTRIICVFNNAIEFNRIDINNYHTFGTAYYNGILSGKIYLSADSITNISYGSNTSNYTKIYDWSFTIHTDDDIEDPQTLTLLPI